MEDQLRLVGLSIDTTTDDAEQLVLDVIAGKVDAMGAFDWLVPRLVATP
ncbi:hypothetical protein [Chondromyces crocatus]|uniref:Uncharacterized protein n=1 Tax=Chondromyces crocatus TaxID=52 RepID=A0A0K1ESK8_CHOCO|nr:hypothetical protein [Chondromyces crocatus]AKT43851.1 uncharacterized protein CMC5_080880 [Chondromyces crocatus]